MGNQNTELGTISKKYVQISNVGKSIVLHGNMLYEELTDVRSTEKDRMKVHQLWTKVSIKIENGVHWYPSCILEWNVVKSLVTKNILTIGAQKDSLEGNPEKEVAEEKAKAVKSGTDEQERQRKVSQGVKEGSKPKEAPKPSDKSLKEISQDSGEDENE